MSAWPSAVIAGIAEGCREAGCALIGGETAEMPGLYAAGDYDLAGFRRRRRRARRASAAHRSRSWRRDPRAPLLRRAFERLLAGAARGRAVRPWLERAPRLSRRARRSAKRCSRRRASMCARCSKPCARRRRIKALAHITGGGLTENIPRVLPDGLAAEINLRSFDLPPVFRWLQAEAAPRRRGDAPDLQLRRRHGDRRRAHQGRRGRSVVAQ